MYRHGIRAVVTAFAFFAALVHQAAFADRTLSLQVVSATVRDKTVPGAEIIFQKIGQNSVSARSDGNGRISVNAPFGGADDRSVTMIAKADGYSTLVVKCPCDGLTYALSEKMTQLDGIRIVLNWGSSPQDLDAHLVYPGNHVWYLTMTGDSSRLDVDSRRGFGPETITINRKFPGQRYVYAVHTFSSGTERDSLRAVSQAVVSVYIGSSLIKSYYFTPGPEDTLHYLFEIDELGVIRNLNKTTSVRGPERVKSTLTAALERRDYNFSALDVAETAKAQAQTANAQGEEAYHAKNLGRAVEHYWYAINNDPQYGQAYSNLGLAYQRQGRTAEAIWANRKAIDLAQGADRNMVRASSFYNIGRIYESQGHWQDALENFQSALRERNIPTYAQAIARMQTKLAR